MARVEGTSSCTADRCSTPALEVRAGMAEQFAQLLAEIRQDYGRRPSLMRELERARLR